MMTDILQTGTLQVHGLTGILQSRRLSGAIPDFTAIITELQNNPEKAREAERRAAEGMAALHAIQAEGTYKNIVPEKYRNMSRKLDTAGSAARQHFYTQAVHAWEQMKTGKTVTLILLGDSGIGKSFFSCWMIHEALLTPKTTTGDIPSYWSCDYVTGSALSARYKNADGYGAHESREHIAHEYTLADLLVVDEIGRYESRYEQQAVFDIADQRQKSMILISQKKGIEFANYAGTAVMDRLNPTALFIDTDGMESWRV
jgi:DNA replication protein DnaC